MWRKKLTLYTFKADLCRNIFALCKKAKQKLTLTKKPQNSVINGKKKNIDNNICLHKTIIANHTRIPVLEKEII